MNGNFPRAPAALARRRAPRVEVPVRPAQPSAHAAAATVARVVAVVAVAAAVAAVLGRRRVQRSLRAPQGMRGGAAAFKGGEGHSEGRKSKRGRARRNGAK